MKKNDFKFSLYQRKKPKAQETSLLSLASSVGFSFVIAIVLGLFGGLWLDKKLNTAPWLTIIGLLMGVVAGFKNLFIIVAKVDRKEKEMKEKQKENDQHKP